MPLIHSSQIDSVVIAGAGGFGVEVFDYLSAEAATGGWTLAGFIDDTPGGGVPNGIELPHLGTIRDYQPGPGQVVLVAVGSVKGRKLVHELLWRRGVETPAYVHSSSIVSPSAQLGRGTIVCPLSIINRDARLGDAVLVNVHCSVGHGAAVGTFSVLSPYAALNGDAAAGQECFLGTRATIYPKISIGDGCIVDSHTGVRAQAPDRQMISSRGTYQVVPLRI